MAIGKREERCEIMIPWWAWLIVGFASLVSGIVLSSIIVELAKRYNENKHKHDHEPVALYYYGHATGFAALAGQASPGAGHTIVLSRCSCGDLVTKDLPGRWMMSDILGKGEPLPGTGNVTIVNEPPFAREWMKTGNIRGAGESAEDFRKRREDAARRGMAEGSRFWTELMEELGDATTAEGRHPWAERADAPSADSAEQDAQRLHPEGEPGLGQDDDGSGVLPGEGVPEEADRDNDGQEEGRGRLAGGSKNVRPVPGSEVLERIDEVLGD
jgi:hypothetical protein